MTMLNQRPGRWIRLLGFFGAIMFTLVFSQACEDKPKSECEVNKDCGSGKFCYKKDGLGTCKRLACEKDADCNNNEKCENGSCVTGGGDKDGDPPKDGGDGKDETKADQGTPDQSDNEGGGSDQATGPCKGLKSCSADGDCGGDKCLGGCCLPKCDADKKCPTGFVCKEDTGQCVVCQQNSDCPVLGQVCDKDAGTCGDAKKCPGGKQPGPDGKCPTACPDAKCAADETPDPGDNCKCIKKIGACESCTKDAECGIGNRCIEDAQKKKFCAIDCTADGKCDSGYQCLSLGDYSVCMPSSGFCPCLGVSCDPGKKCCKERAGSNTCYECCNDKDCTKAGDVCRADGTCGSSDPCKGVTCEQGTQQCNSTTGKCDCASPCPTGTCCGATDTKCSAAACGNPNPPCNPPCASGQKCCPSPAPGLPNQCLASCPNGTGSQCKTDADCKSGEICCAAFLGQCLPATDPLSKIILQLFCGSSSNSCPPGATKCSSDADCNAGQKCQLPPIPSPGASGCCK